jgi:hypothetical protein
MRLLLHTIGKRRDSNVGSIFVRGRFPRSRLLCTSRLLPEPSKKMRIIRLPFLPEWRDRIVPVYQERLVHRLFLNHEKVRRVCYWHEPHGAVYLDIQMGPSGPLGTWHTYWATSRLEWIRTLDYIRDLYQGASEIHERMTEEFEDGLRAWAEGRPKKKPMPLHNWAKEGF